MHYLMLLLDAGICLLVYIHKCYETVFIFSYISQRNWNSPSSSILRFSSFLHPLKPFKVLFSHESNHLISTILFLKPYILKTVQLIVEWALNNVEEGMVLNKSQKKSIENLEDWRKITNYLSISWFTNFHLEKYL